MLQKKINKIKRMLVKDGMRTTLAYLLERSKGRRIDIFQAYDYIPYQPFGGPYTQSSHNRIINWIIPDIHIGSAVI